MPVPDPTPILRLIHIDNLRVCLKRRALHAPNDTPDDGLVYRTIHRTDIQEGRRERRVPAGPHGVVHDYVPFYFGYLSPMLFQPKTGWVAEYQEGQTPLIYLMSTAQEIRDAGIPFVFSDGHGLSAYTEWFDDLDGLDQIDWSVVNQRYWADKVSDMDRQRRKQAEFLVHGRCPWGLIDEIGVIDDQAKKRVESILSEFPEGLGKDVRVHQGWYY